MQERRASVFCVSDKVRGCSAKKGDTPLGVVHLTDAKSTFSHLTIKQEPNDLAESTQSEYTNDEARL